MPAPESRKSFTLGAFATPRTSIACCWPKSDKDFEMVWAMRNISCVRTSRLES